MANLFNSLFSLVCVLFFALPVQAQQVHQELQEVVQAEVLNIISEEELELFGTGAVETVQVVEARVTSGDRDGAVITFENDMVPLSAGDNIFLNRLENIEGIEYFIFKDTNRTWPLLTLSLLFVGVLVWFAGRQGIRALISLIISIGAIIFLLVPALLAGYSPALSSLVISAIILAVVLFGTHGFNARSTIAFGGTFLAVAATCVIAAIWSSSMRLSGFGSDASVYLNFATGGTLDFAGLLLGSIIIGILGVLDDVSITQASVVQELRYANQTLNGVELYHRAIRVGRDHVGSLVNTLALAYVGSALPLVLLFAQSNSSLFMIINQEVVAAEFLRIVVGSIGLVLAVPLTTALAAWWFAQRAVDESDVSLHAHHHHH